MRITWWNAGMFWVNTLLLPLGLVMLAWAARCLRRPSRSGLVTLGLILLIALEVHLAALVAVPVIAVAGIAQWRSGPSDDRGGRAALIVAATFVLLALVPYVLSEVQTGFQNTRAMFAHADTAVHSDRSAGRIAAVDTLVRSLDPLEMVSGSSAAGAIAAGGTLTAIALMLTRGNWLVVAATAGIAGQALFFLLMARPLNGLHYVSLLAPLYPVPFAAIVSALIPTRRQTPHDVVTLALAAGTILFVALRGPVLADRYAEHTAWTYRGVVSALDQLCGGETVRTIEGPGLADGMNPGYDGVLRYLVTRGFTRCRYAEGASIAIVDNRDGRAFAEQRDINGERFLREAVAEPGLARYRRAGDRGR
jgi:hypothetical protein